MLEEMHRRLLGQQPKICLERAQIVTEVWNEYRQKSPVIKRAIALSETLKRMSIYLEESQLLFGNFASSPKAAPLFPEYSSVWLEKEIDGINNRPVDKFQISEGDKQKVHEIAKKWKGCSLEDKVMDFLGFDVKKAMEIKALLGAHMMSSGPGHLAVDYELALNLGFKGFIQWAERKKSVIDLTVAENLSKKEFYEAIIIVMNAAINFCNRFYELIIERVGLETNLERKNELLKLSKIAKNLESYPPSTFSEALQMVWLVQIILQLESNGHSMSLGRFDQYMLPFYQKDLIEKRIDREKALKLICCFYLKLYTINKVRPWAHTEYAAGYPMYQNLTIGGQTLTKEAVNDLTFLCLDAMTLMKLPTPNLSARYYSRSSETYLKKCVDVISLGYGMPAMENDEVIIPSLLNRGVSLEDAYNYCMVGCVEVGVSGKWGYRCNGMTFMNFVKIFELTLNGGIDPVTGNVINKVDESMETFKGMEDVLKCYQKHLNYLTKLEVILDNTVDYWLEKDYPDPFCSALVNNCIERGKTIMEGGAIYDMVSGTQVGVANIANSLASIEKAVFQEKIISGSELLELLKDNFESPLGQRMRQYFLNKSPKYGNDDDAVDKYANLVQEFYCREIAGYKNSRFSKGPIGGNYYASSSTISSNVPAGKGVGALPDGRKKGEPLAEGISPYPGTDVVGPTAVMKSVSKLPNIEITGGNLLNLKFSPLNIQSDSGKLKMIELIKTFSLLKGWHVQFNVISGDTLREAMEKPEQYRGLVVRVAGYCAFYTELSIETQLDIIRRTEYGMLA